ncbi:MAG: signal peptidase I [Tissierellia bacterium]|nr:signal peptidase I [Tissierellia bacterium]
MEKKIFDGKIKEFGIELFKALAIALFIKFFLFDITTVDGASMNPTLENGDRLLVTRISTFFREAERGELVIFKSPTDGRLFIKRVIGVGGDLVEIHEGKVYLNNQALIEDYIDDGIKTEIFFEDKWKVPDGYYFVLGDNRKPNGSTDSRIFGLIDKNSIKSYAEFRIFPFDSIERLERYHKEME